MLHQNILYILYYLCYSYSILEKWFMIFYDAHTYAQIPFDTRELTCIIRFTPSPAHAAVMATMAACRALVREFRWPHRWLFQGDDSKVENSISEHLKIKLSVQNSQFQSKAPSFPQKSLNGMPHTCQALANGIIWNQKLKEVQKGH